MIVHVNNLLWYKIQYSTVDEITANTRTSLRLFPNSKECHFKHQWQFFLIDHSVKAYYVYNNSIIYPKDRQHLYVTNTIWNFWLQTMHLIPNKSPNAANLILVPWYRSACRRKVSVRMYLSFSIPIKKRWSFLGQTSIVRPIKTNQFWFKLLFTSYFLTFSFLDKLLMFHP